MVEYYLGSHPLVGRQKVGGWRVLLRLGVPPLHACIRSVFAFLCSVERCCVTSDPPLWATLFNSSLYSVSITTNCMSRRNDDITSTCQELMVLDVLYTATLLPIHNVHPQPHPPIRPTCRHNF